MARPVIDSETLLGPVVGLQRLSRARGVPIGKLTDRVRKNSGCVEISRKRQECLRRPLGTKIQNSGKDREISVKSARKTASDKVTQVRLSTGRYVGAVRYILGEGDPVDHCPTIGKTHKTRETCGSIYDSLWGTKHIKLGQPAGVSMTLVREPNTYIRTIEILVYPFSSLFKFNTQFTGKSSSLSLTVVHLSRRSRFFPSLLAAKDKSTSTRLTQSTSLLLSWFSREVFTCTHLEGIVVSYTFDFYLHNLLVPVSETVIYSWS